MNSLQEACHELSHEEIIKCFDKLEKRIQAITEKMAVMEIKVSGLANAILELEDNYQKSNKQ